MQPEEDKNESFEMEKLSPYMKACQTKKDKKQPKPKHFRLTEKDLQQVYLFVDKVPSDRVKKNLNRDFSDCSYMAELIKFYLPASHKRLIDVHNYVPTF